MSLPCAERSWQVAIGFQAQGERWGMAEVRRAPVEFSNVSTILQYRFDFV